MNASRIRIFLFYSIIMIIKSYCYKYLRICHHISRLSMTSSVIVPPNVNIIEDIAPLSLNSISVASWNINGLRSLFKHDHDGSVLNGLIKRRNIDILCLQETKLQESHTSDMADILHERFGAKKVYWTSSRARKGYSGLATIILNDQLSGILSSDAIGEPEGDLEGRTLTFIHEKFIVVNVYTPNSGEGLRRLGYRTSIWDARFGDHLLQLRADHPHHLIIVMGDLNVAHQAIDYHNHHKSSSKFCAGTTPQEQLSFAENLLTRANFHDIYRTCYPDLRKYSYFSPRKGMAGREKNEGWRLDYVLVNFPKHANINIEAPNTLTSWLQHPPFIEDELCHPYSDHCPVGASFRLQ